MPLNLLTRRTGSIALVGWLLLSSGEVAWAQSHARSRAHARGRSAPRLRLPSVDQQAAEQEAEQMMEDSEPVPEPEKAVPHVPHPVSCLFESLWAYENRAAEPGGESAESVYNASALTGFVRLGDSVRFTGRLRFEPVSTMDGGQQMLPRSTLYLEVTELTWHRGAFEVFGGKIHPRFGWALANLPGLYSGVGASDYELRERLGAGGRVDLHRLLALPEALGGLNLQVEAFGVDNSPLSYGAFHPRWLQTVYSTHPDTGETVSENIRRWLSSEEIGGAGNTGSMASTAVSLEADRIRIPGGHFGYSVALSSQKPGWDAVVIGQPATELGAVGAVHAKFALPWDMALEPVLELARRDSAGGINGFDLAWSTAAVTLSRGGLGFTCATLSRRETDSVMGLEVSTTQHVASLSLDFGELTRIDLLKPVSAFVEARQIRQSGSTIPGMAVGLQVDLSF